jgi:hypothetical protein
VNWQIESGRDDLTDDLPDYDLVFNAMGDPDQIGDALLPQTRFIENCAKPLLNHPDKVARTARHQLPALLDGMANIVVPLSGGWPPHSTGTNRSSMSCRS